MGPLPSSCRRKAPLPASAQGYPGRRAGSEGTRRDAEMDSRPPSPSPTSASPIHTVFSGFLDEVGQTRLRGFSCHLGPTLVIAVLLMLRVIE